jgi:hypothetical protein
VIIRSRPTARSSYLGLLLVLVGVVALLQGLRWYDGHLEKASSPPARPAAARPPSPSRSRTPRAAHPPAEELPEASPEELQALSSSEWSVQADAIDTLLKRRMTPELAQAIRDSQPLNAVLAEKRVCLEARLPGRETLGWILSKLPVDDAIWPPDVDQCECLLKALASRSEEAPERIAVALLPFAMSYPLRLREAALQGLSRIELHELSPEIRRLIDDGWHRGLAVKAAFALRADELAPERVEAWLFDPEDSVRRATRSSLESAPRQAAARLLVSQALEHRDDRDLVRSLRARERSQHDVTDELIQVALDPAMFSDSRQGALELLASLGDASLVPRLEPLRSGADPVLRAYAEAAIKALEKRRPRARPRRGL